MWIAALIIRVGEQHVGSVAPDFCHQPATCVVMGCSCEAVGVRIGIAPSHPRVAVPKHYDVVKPNGLRTRRQFCRTHLRDGL